MNKQAEVSVFIARYDYHAPRGGLFEGLLGAGSGMILGAIVGSIIPVAGTAVGAVLGGAIGGVAALGVARLGGAVDSMMSKDKK